MNSLLGIDLPFYSYGILMGFAFILGVFLFQYNAKNSKYPRPSSIDLLLVLSIAGVVGARVNYILLFPQYYNSLRDYLAIHEGGLVFYGGFILATISLLIFCKIKRYNFSMVADYMVPSLAIGHAIGRIGCLINDCCYGATTKVIQIYHLKTDSEGIYRHPTQIYEMIYLTILAIVSMIIFRTNWFKSRAPHGLIVNIYIIAYAILRFLNEYLRDDSRGGFFTSFNLSPAQMTSIILIICGILWGSYIIIKQKSNVDCGEKKHE